MCTSGGCHSQLFQPRATNHPQNERRSNSSHSVIKGRDRCLIAEVEPTFFAVSIVRFTPRCLCLCHNIIKHFHASKITRCPNGKLEGTNRCNYVFLFVMFPADVHRCITNLANVP